MTPSPDAEPSVTPDLPRPTDERSTRRDSGVPEFQPLELVHASWAGGISGVPQFHRPELVHAGWRGRSGSRRMRRCPRSLRPGRPTAEAVALAVDLIALAVAAGLTPFLAAEMAGRAGPPVLADRLHAALAAADGGLRFADALDAEAARCPDLAPLLALLAASERSGAPVAPALTRLAASIRAQARRRAMARARTVPVRLLFPLVFLVLPAFLVLTVAPVVLASLNH